MENIKKYKDQESYNIEDYPTEVSRVGLIESNREVKIDPVYLFTKQPQSGDACYHDGSKYLFLKGGDALNTALLPKNFTPVGCVEGWIGDEVLVVNKSSSSTKFCQVVQFSITAISAATIKFWLKMAGDYATFVPIEVTLTDSSNGYINATTATEIKTALEDAGNTNNVGYDKHGYWAFHTDSSEQPVESGGTKIIVQCDNWYDYRQYQCSDNDHALVGCTMALSVWGDMPASTVYFKKNGKSTNYLGKMNDKFNTYYSINGRTPNANEGLYIGGNTTPVTLAAFNSSQYCQLLRDTYGDYDTYINEEFGIAWPQHYGSFATSGRELTKKYAPLFFTKKNGDQAFKFPALATAAAVGYTGIKGIEVGDWFLPGCEEGLMLMTDENIVKQNAFADKTKTTKITKDVVRWFAQRYTAKYARIFTATYGTLNYSAVYSTNAVQAVTLLKP